MSEAIQVYVLHENEEWYKPLHEALVATGVPTAEWNLAQGQIRLDQPPPLGIFYSKMSASSYTRGHLHAKHFMAATLEWLSAHKRRVINGKCRTLVRTTGSFMTSLPLRHCGMSHRDKPFTAGIHTT